MSEIPGLGEGIEAVRVVMQGTEIFLRLSGHAAGWTVDRIAKCAVLFAHHAEKKKHEMKEGEVNFKELLKDGKNGVNMMQIENDSFQLFKDYAREMGLSYSIMPDINKQDTYMEIAYSELQGEAFRYYISQHPDVARTYTYGEYFNNANPVDMEAEIKGLGKEAMEYAQELKSKEQTNEYPVQSKREEFTPLQSQQPTNAITTFIGDPNYIAVPFEPSLLKPSLYDGVTLLAVPNTENEYIQIYSDQITVNDGEFMLHLYGNGTYFLCDGDEQPIPQEDHYKCMSGAEYKTAVEKMKERTEINLKRREERKRSVKFVNRTPDGKTMEKIVKGGVKKPVEELEQLLSKAHAQRR